MIEKEAITHFKGKNVKIRLLDGFNLTGTILEIYQESLLFKTSQAESLISISDIKQIVGLGGY
jgi:ribosome maturation factor RimP